MVEVKRRRGEYRAGLGAVLVAVAIASFGLWPVPDTIATDGVLETIVKDRILIGMVRLMVVMMALYAIASVPALVVGGRWVKGMGTSGILADDARVESRTLIVEAQDQVDALQKRSEELEAVVDDLWALVENETAPE